MPTRPAFARTAAENRQWQLEDMSEAVFQAQVIARAKALGWQIYHTKDSRRSQPGYPDLHLWHPRQQRSMFRELKKSTGKVSPAQKQVLESMTAAGLDAAVWWPADLDGRIIDELRGKPRG